MTKLAKVAKNDAAQPGGIRSTSKPKAATPSQAKEAGDMLAPAGDCNQPPTPTPVAAPEQPSKQNRLAAMLVRDEGATLDAMVETTGWLKHTVRAALTGLKKKGYALSSDKVDGVRTYRAVAPE